MLRLRRAAAPLMLAMMLTACGGGGGATSSGNGGTPTTPAGPALSFTPATASATYTAGTSVTLNVSAAVARPADFANASVFPVVSDDSGAILPTSQLVKDSDTQYHAVLLTAPSLAAGSHKGNLTVKLCRDSACAGQFPGSPMLLPYDFQVNPAGLPAFNASSALPLTATMHVGGAAPSNVAVAVVAEGRSWTASTGAPWLQLSSTSGSGNATLSVSYATGTLLAGTYNTAVNFSSSDGQVASLPASLTVLPNGLVISSAGVAFNAINGAAIPSQSVVFDTDNKVSTVWSVASDATWLTATPGAGTTTPAATVLTINPSIAPLASGNYNATLTLSSPNLDPRKLPVALTLVAPTLLASSNSVTLGGTYGRDFSTQSLTLSLNTGGNSWPWTLSTPPAWLAASALSGSVNQTGSKIVLTPLPAAAGASAPLSTQLSASAKVNGDTVTTQVLMTLNRDQHKLLPSETAVGFTATPGWNRLSRTLTVTDNYGNFGGMNALSSQPWLTASVTGNKLTLTADPTGLGIDSQNSATVTLLPQDPSVVTPEPIRVVLWKGSLTPLVNSRLAQPYTTIVADPLRPLVYAHNGGAFIDVYNVYNGQKVATLSGYSGTLGDMAVSPNGDRLYLVDIDNHLISVVDLTTRLPAGQWPLTAGGDRGTRIRAIRPNGVELVVLGDGAIYLAASGKRLSGLTLGGGSLAASSDGKRLYQQDEGNTGVQLTTSSLDYADLAGGTLFAARIPAASHAGGGGAGMDIAVSLDGSKVYSASATPKLCTVLNPADLGLLSYLPSGDAAPNNIEVGNDGRVYCGVAGKNSTSDVWIYNDSGVLVTQIKLAATGKQLLPRQMVLSADGMVLIGLTDDNLLNLAPIGP